MKLIIIFGPQAVGKMTVGHELEKITGLRLFHNHMTIELVANFFNYSTPTGKKLVKMFREEIFKEVASSDMEGLIFTYLWNFDYEGDAKYIDEVIKIFRDRNDKAEIYLVELEADLESRLERNKTEHRLNHKPTKRDVVWSEGQILKNVEEHRQNSLEGEIKEKNYLRINNTNLSAEEVAGKIKTTFNL